MTPEREPTDAEREAAVRHHQRACSYPGYGNGSCPLDDLPDPLDRYLDSDLEAVTMRDA